MSYTRKYTYIWIFISYLMLLLLVHSLFYSNQMIHAIGTLICFQIASILTCFWIFRTYRRSDEDRPFWLLVLLACTTSYISVGMELPMVLTNENELLYPHPLYAFYTFQYVLYFLAFAYKLYKKNKTGFLLQFMFDAIFLLIVTIYIIGFLMSDQTQGTEYLVNFKTYILYFLALVISLYASLSAMYHFQEFPVYTRKLMLYSVTLSLIFEYVYFYRFLHHLYVPWELDISIHSISNLCIGIAAALCLHTNPTPIKEEGIISKINYLRLFLPYVSVLIIFEFIFLHFTHNKWMLVGLGLAILLLFVRQVLLWLDNKNLLYTYHRLNEQLEVKVKEGVQALAKRELQYKSLFEDHPDAIFSLDINGHFQHINHSCMEILGHTYEELKGQSFLQFVIEDDQYITREHMRQANRGKSQTFEVRAIQSEETYTYLQVTLIPTILGSETIGMYGIAKDTTELKQNQRQIVHMAFHDALTGLANRRRFEECLAESLTASMKRETMVAVLFIDLDRFKKINDRLGHDIGDLLLVEVGKRLQQVLRSKDVVARQGGDEFTVLLTDVFSQKTAVHVAKRIIDELNQPFMIRNNELKITPSIGIALYPSHGTNVTKLMKNADIAMYRAKYSGKNKFMFYSTDMSDVEDEKHFLEGELHKALHQNELVLHYQPQVDVKSQKIIGFEALLRWKHPKFGMVSPARFIPLAEETGLIVPIGEWVLKTACQQARKWHEQGYDLKVAVNLSPLQFKQPNLVQLVSTTLLETQLPPEKLDLEITERVAMNEEEQVIRKLKSLQDLHVKISIDDFGTGYSSLSYLTKYPIHTLKIAREFIKEIENSTQEEAIISSIIMMAKNLRLTVIAEGVETNSQWAFLDNQQCDQIQGFYVSQPVDEEHVWNILREEREKQII